MTAETLFRALKGGSCYERLRINEFRKKFGKNMAYKGGVDKREMAKGGKAIEREIERLRPVIKDGGFIPSCDHGIPSDVSWPNFVYYVKLLAKETGWL